MNALIFLSVLVLMLCFIFVPSTQIIIGGIGVFFFGIMLLEKGIKGFSGGALEGFLKSTTNTTPKAMLTGIITTATVQSSTLISLLAISFMGAGLIRLSSGIGIIFGANLGTTVSSWLVAFFGLKLSISSYALSMAAIAAVFNLSKNISFKSGANVLLGICLLLLAIGYIQDGFLDVKSVIDFSSYQMSGFLGVVVFSFIGVLVTVVVQSSLGTMVLVLSALSTNQISYDNALAIAIGANVGTTLTAILSALASNASAKRLAAAHVLFNVVTGLLAIVFLPFLKELVDLLAAFFAIDDLMLKLTLFHSIFNLLGIVVMTPFIGKMEQILTRKILDRRQSKSTPKFINTQLTQDPTAFILALKMELEEMFKGAYFALARSINLTKLDIKGQESLKQLIKTAKKNINIDLKDYYQTSVKPMFNACLELSTTAQTLMQEKDIMRVYRYKNCARDISELTKEANELNSNLQKYSFSKNEQLANEYRSIKHNLAKMIRKTYQISKNPNDISLIIKFVSLKIKLQENEEKTSLSVDRLIRENKITASQGTSLINDSHYAYLIGLKLVQIVQGLYMEEEQDIMQIYEKWEEDETNQAI